MASHGQRRPICGGCAKPVRLCLCARLRAPPLDTAVSVTVLQHAQEAKHPLNSTRVARLGLRNLAVATVTDVNLHASFVLRPLDGERSDLGATQVGASGPSAREGENLGRNGQNGGEILDTSGNFENYVQNIGEKLDLGMTQMGNCGDLCQESREFSDGPQCGHDRGKVVDLGKSWLCNCGDLDAEVWNCSDGGERFDLGNTKIAISTDLSQESGDCANGVKCCRDGGERLDSEKSWFGVSSDLVHGDGNPVNGLECDHHGGDRLELGKSPKHTCNDLSGKDWNSGKVLKCGCFGASRSDFAPVHMKNCGDLDQEIGFVPTQMQTSNDSGQKICGNELKYSNGCGVIHLLGGKKLDSAPASQVGISVTNVGDCGNGSIVELDQMEVEDQVLENPELNGSERFTEDRARGNLVHPSAAKLLDFEPTIGTISDEKCGSSHSCECKQDTETEADAKENWTEINMEKCKVAYSENELRIAIERTVKPKIRWLSRTPVGQAAVSKGFVVKKTQAKKCNLAGDVCEFEEFEITIPPQSALLFPCQRSISIDALDVEVRHLVVLDGTWSKAQRMYHENPWLQILPHLKLDTETVSLYSEVRHEPRAGCLSTIESIVCAMKKLGEDAEGLNHLLDVFESMIVDQRRCKDENFRLKSQS